MNTQSISVNACLCADSDCKEWLSVGKIKVIHDRNGFKKVGACLGYRLIFRVSFGIPLGSVR